MFTKNAADNLEMNGYSYTVRFHGDGYAHWDNLTLEDALRIAKRENADHRPFAFSRFGESSVEYQPGRYVRQKIRSTEFLKRSGQL